MRELDELLQHPAHNAAAKRAFDAQYETTQATTGPVGNPDMIGLAYKLARKPAFGGR